MRARSRSPAVDVGTPLQDVGRRLNEALDRYKKVKAEKRAGKDFQRRRKSLVLTILEYYIHLVQIGVAASNGDRKYIRRLNQAQEELSDWRRRRTSCLCDPNQFSLEWRTTTILKAIVLRASISHCRRTNKSWSRTLRDLIDPQGASESSSVVSGAHCIFSDR